MKSCVSGTVPFFCLFDQKNYFKTAAAFEGVWVSSKRKFISKELTHFENNRMFQCELSIRFSYVLEYINQLFQNMDLSHEAYKYLTSNSANKHNSKRYSAQKLPVWNIKNST